MVWFCPILKSKRGRVEFVTASPLPAQVSLVLRKILCATVFELNVLLMHITEGSVSFLIQMRSKGSLQIIRQNSVS